jgi:hypothetical protein
LPWWRAPAPRPETIRRRNMASMRGGGPGASWGILEAKSPGGEAGAVWARGALRGNQRLAREPLEPFGQNLVVLDPPLQGD